MKEKKKDVGYQKMRMTSMLWTLKCVVQNDDKTVRKGQRTKKPKSWKAGKPEKAGKPSNIILKKIIEKFFVDKNTRFGFLCQFRTEALLGDFVRLPAIQLTT